LIEKLHLTAIKKGNGGPLPLGFSRLKGIGYSAASAAGGTGCTTDT
jgi:hypothetical protein